MGKLVRDLIPAIIEAEGRAANVRVLTPDERGPALQAKLDEEVAEFRDADADHLAEELADVLEVLRALAAHHALEWNDVESVREMKLRARGGFAAGVFLLD